MAIVLGLCCLLIAGSTSDVPATPHRGSEVAVASAALRSRVGNLGRIVGATYLFRDHWSAAQEAAHLLDLGVH